MSQRQWTSRSRLWFSLTLPVSVLFAVVAVSALLLQTACGRVANRRPRPLLELVDPASVVVLLLDWQTVRGDAFLYGSINAVVFERPVNRLGLEPSQIAEVVVFGSDDRSVVVLIRGSFDASRLIAQRREAGWRSDTPQRAFSPEGESLLAVVDSVTVAVGDPTAVLAIAARTSARLDREASQLLRRVAGRLDGNAPVRAIVQMPQSVQDMTNVGLELSEIVLNDTFLAPLGHIVNSIGIGPAVGYSMRHVGSSLPVRLVAEMRDERSATLVSGVLQGMKTLASLVPADQASSMSDDAGMSLRQLSVDRAGATLSIDLVLDERSVHPGQ